MYSAKMRTFLGDVQQESYLSFVQTEFTEEKTIERSVPLDAFIFIQNAGKDSTKISPVKVIFRPCIRINVKRPAKYVESRKNRNCAK